MPAMLVRALRKSFVEALALGTCGLVGLIAWSRYQGVSLGTIVLLALVVSAIGVTLLVLAILTVLPFQYLRHRNALREEIRKHGPLSDEERREALVARRMAPDPLACRDPRVVPWWEW